MYNRSGKETRREIRSGFVQAAPKGGAANC